MSTTLLDNLVPAKVKALAKIVHEANRAFCESIGDTSLVPWEDTPQEIKESAISGVYEVLENPQITNPEIHDKWTVQKVEDGWVYGDEKDPEAKTHPCLVDYHMLSAAHRYKDALFLAIVKSYIDFTHEIDESDELTGAEQDTLLCLFTRGPTEDGDIPSKSGRDSLFVRGLVFQYDGWQSLTQAGLERALLLTADKK